MADERSLLLALSQFARCLAAGFEVDEVLQDLAQQVTKVLGLAGAGVSLAGGNTIRFATAPDEVTAAVERLQEDLQEGPCLDAHRGGEPVLVADLRDDPDHWPGFARRAIALGVVAVAAIPMRLDDTRLGTLNLYTTSRRDWSDDDVTAAQVLADMATGYITHASELDRSRRAAEQLQEALSSRVVIEQAKGMLAAERHISVDQAFGMIRCHARNRGASLRAVATAIVNLGLRPLPGFTAGLRRVLPGRRSAGQSVVTRGGSQHPLVV